MTKKSVPINTHPPVAQISSQQLTKTYGKGLKLLQKLGGYSPGQGIGKSNQGRAEPIAMNQPKAGEAGRGIGLRTNETAVVEKRSKVREEDELMRRMDAEDKVFKRLLRRRRDEN